MAAKKTIVALNIGAQKISMGLFAPGSNGLQLRRYSSVDLPGDPAGDAARPSQIQSAVADLASTLKVKGSPVRFAVSGKNSFLRFVKLPPLGGDQVDQIVEFEAQQNVPFPLDEVAWDYHLIGDTQGTGEMEVAIAAVKKDYLDEVTDSISSTLVPESVDAAPVALYNAFRHNYADVAEPVLLIDIGARSANLIYIDGENVFARNTTAVGGAAITQAIAKEFGGEFPLAEQRKVADGLVNLGGGYEDPEDPEVAAISKVIRNSLTRLHADIVRTTNQYRGQQGGAAPQRIFLAGGTASLPYAKEFFEEKLSLPVEHFNPLRAVALSPDVNTEQAGAEAHTLGELVGLALTSAGASSMNIDLVPTAVDRSRDVQKRRPFLLMSAAAILGILGAGVFHFVRGNAVLDDKFAKLEEVRADLANWDSQISEVNDSLKDDTARGDDLSSTVEFRSFWLELLSDVNSRLTGDSVWITELAPLAGTSSVTGKEIDSLAASVAATYAKKDSNVMDGLFIRGLYRDGTSGPAEVNALLNSLKDSDFFDLSGLDSDRSAYNTELITSAKGDKWAFPFEFVLPLKQPVEFLPAN
ncbi:pilus assembly protein PilM [Verrucomicrobiales bacterium]|nr:pilus assembly protein PilM [Verrucomicrobiales bacterium]